MDPDRAWSRWLAALADPACPLEVVLCGRQRLAGWDMGRRTLGDHMLHLVDEGGHLGAVAGRPVRTGPGDALWVPAGVEQVLRQRDDVRWFAKRNLRFILGGAEPPPLPAVVHGAAGIAGHLDAIRGEWPSRAADRGVRLRALLVLLFSDLRRCTGLRAGGLDADAQARLLAMVDRDPAGRHHPAALARAVGLAPALFGRRFRRTYGCAPRAWLLRHRIQRAAARLETATAIGMVAADFGYRDLFLFSRQFRQVMGTSPRDYRRSLAGGGRPRD